MLQSRLMNQPVNISDTTGALLLRQSMLPGHEALNARLRPMLLEMAGRIPDRGTNQATGKSYFERKWLSASELHLLDDPALKTLAGMIEATADTLPWPQDKMPPFRIFSMWSIVSRRGMEGRRHRHAGRVSGAYYVDAGDCDDTGNGAFAVYDQQGRVVRTVPPKTGMMLMFPNTLWHGVLRYDSDTPRIVISFNLT